MAYLFEVMNKTFSCLDSGSFARAKHDLKIEKLNIWQTQGFILTKKVDEKILAEIFVDPLTQMGFSKAQLVSTHLEKNFPQAQFVLTIGFKAGVTDNTGTSAQDALKLFDQESKVSTLTRYFVETDLTLAELTHLAQEYLYNDLIQTFEVQKLSDLSFQQRFEKCKFPAVELENITDLYQLIDFTQSLETLTQMNDKNCWALSLDEIGFLKEYFQSKTWLERRELAGLSPLPTDVEVEVIAQSWSEHCKHKIFGAEIEYTEDEKAPGKIGKKSIKGLYPQYIKKSTYELRDSGVDWPISVFKDNAGIVRFDEHLDLCLKVETHNSPSALDPYGGALTGILGVNRDIMGTGLGAKPVANLDVFCLAPPSWPLPGKEKFMPAGLKTPKRLLEGVHKGVEDGGNKSGIPTVGGAIVFDQDYAGKPLVFVGTLGVMPATLPSGISSTHKRTKVGDKIVVIGGAVGADGIHGATFSSLELNENSPATAVQIGDPLTQKRVLDLLLQARDLELFTGLTDNGAGGLSSSLGEMATITGGARFDLALCPLKYPNLRPFEIMISESQERMSLSVDPQKIDQFCELAQQYGVSASVLGEFTDTGYLEVFYQDSKVADLNLDFLHESLPPMKLIAHWSGPRARSEWMPLDAKKTFDPKDLNQYKTALLELLSTPNIASKESWVRQYDHEVQGATAVKPFQGKNQEGPSDAGAIWLGAHGGDKNGAVCLGLGLAPRLSAIDPFLMAQVAVDEAVRNLVATGANPEKIALLDNFCWPDPVASAKNPEGERKCAELVRSCEGLYQAVMTYRTPLISGKDSMKNDFRGKNLKGDPLQISILPTLLVTGMGHTQIDHLVPSVFQQADDIIYLLGRHQKGLLASEYAEIYQHDDPEMFICDLEANHLLYQRFYQAVKLGMIQSAHDVSDGGALCTLSESMIGSMLGASVNVKKDLHLLFGEAPGRLMVSVSPTNSEKFEEHFKDIELEKWGLVTNLDRLDIYFEGNQELQISLSDLRSRFLQEF